MGKIKSFAVAFGIGLSLGTLTVFVARAEPAVPKVFSGVPFGKGQWKMEMLDGPQKAEMARAGVSGMSICMDAAREMVTSNPAMARQAKASEDSCTSKVLKDTPAEARVESICPEMRTLATITRVSPTALQMAATMTDKKGKVEKMTARMTYQGKCAADGAVVKADRNSAMCKQMKREMAGMDPNMCAQLQGSARSMCEQQMGPMLKQMKAMCQ